MCGFSRMYEQPNFRRRKLRVYIFPLISPLFSLIFGLFSLYFGRVFGLIFRLIIGIMRRYVAVQVRVLHGMVALQYIHI